MQDLLYLSSIPPALAAMRYAAGLARCCEASLTGLHVCEPVTMQMEAGLPGAANIQLAWAQERLARAHAAESEFERCAHQAGVCRSSWMVAQGPTPETVAQIGNWHDLLIVERNDSAAWGTINAVGQLIMTAGLPVLALPQAPAKAASLDAIAIAWNGSPESTRALHAARPWLRRAQRILLLRGQRHVPFSPVIEAPAFDPGDYLEQQGFAFDTCSIEHPDEHPGEQILEHCRARGIDILVMGGYARSRFGEWVLGGATRHVLRAARIPVLLVH